MKQLQQHACQMSERLRDKNYLQFCIKTQFVVREREIETNKRRNGT
jgi:hypothetical protein